MDIRSEDAFNQAYKLIESCHTIEAGQLLDNALSGNLDNEELVNAVYYCNFWNGPLNRYTEASYFEQGEMLLNNWKVFDEILKKDNCQNEDLIYAFKKGVFSLALSLFNKASDEKDPALKSDILRKTGLCYKKLGSYETALSFLTESNTTLTGQSSVLAEMADCYALCGETKNAKMLFREAFYLDAQKIDLTFLDSKLIKVLVEKVTERGYEKGELLEWIPVYGVLLGVFNIKRPLRTQEVLRLKQEIYAKENELKDPSNNRAVIVPRLLNLYFWLIDSYTLSKESISRINEVMLKIKILDEDIHAMYIA